MQIITQKPLHWAITDLDMKPMTMVEIDMAMEARKRDLRKQLRRFLPGLSATSVNALIENDVIMVKLRFKIPTDTSTPPISEIGILT